MIKFYKNYPNILINISSFQNNDYIHMKNIINNIIDYSNKNKKKITIYVDTFNLEKYSLLYVYKLISFNSKFTLLDIQYITNIELFINYKNKNIIDKFISILQVLCPIKININYIIKQKKWHKIFKEIYIY